MNKKNFEKNMQNKSKLYNTNRSYTIQLKLYNINKNCANAKLHFTKIKEIAIKKKVYSTMKRETMKCRILTVYPN